MPVTGSTLLLISLGATAASAALAAQQARQQGKDASAIAEHNAQLVRKQAGEKVEALKVAGQAKQKQILDERRRVLARNRAKFGKAGVTMEGSPLLVQQEVAKNITQDAAMANFNNQVEIRRTISAAEGEAELSLLRGKSAERAGKLKAGAALFSGATQIVSTKQQFSQAS